MFNEIFFRLLEDVGTELSEDLVVLMPTLISFLRHADPLVVKKAITCGTVLIAGVLQEIAFQVFFYCCNQQTATRYNDMIFLLLLFNKCWLFFVCVKIFSLLVMWFPLVLFCMLIMIFRFSFCWLDA